jgi:membrane associated rhomboid family serine protease
MGTNSLLVNIPVITIFKFQVWRVLTCIVTNMSIINLLFSGLMVWYVSNTSETQEGTARILLKYVYYHLVIQITYTVFGILVLGMMFNIWKVFSSGIWPVYFVFITLRCMANPEGYSQ